MSAPDPACVVQVKHGTIRATLTLLGADEGGRQSAGHAQGHGAERELAAEAVASIERTGLSPEVKEKIAHLNARRVLASEQDTAERPAPVATSMSAGRRTIPAGRWTAPNYPRRLAISAVGRPVCRLTTSVIRSFRGGQSIMPWSL